MASCDSHDHQKVLNSGVFDSFIFSPQASPDLNQTLEAHQQLVMGGFGSRLVDGDEVFLKGGEARLKENIVVEGQPLGSSRVNFTQTRVPKRTSAVLVKTLQTFRFHLGVMFDVGTPYGMRLLSTWKTRWDGLLWSRSDLSFPKTPKMHVIHL